MTTGLACLLLSVLCTPRTPGGYFDQASTGLRGESAAVAGADSAARHGGAPSPIHPAKGRFLIASPTLGDPNFSESVVLLLAYDAHGAMGVIVNRPTDVRLTSALPDIEELRNRSDRVYLGGPVSGNMMVILLRSAMPLQASEQIFADVYATGSAAALRQALSKAGKANPLRAYMGHAGWGPGQLENEIARGDWHVTPADAATVFATTPSDIWPKLIKQFSGQWTHIECPSSGGCPRPG